MLLNLYSEIFAVDVIAGYGAGFERPSAPPSACRSVTWVPLRLQHGRNPLYSTTVAGVSWLRGRSLRVGKLHTRALTREITKALSCRYYDLVHVDFSLMIDSVPARTFPLIVSSQNVEPEVFKTMRDRRTGVARCAAAIEAGRVLVSERRAMHRADAVIAMTDRDARLLAALHHTPRSRIIPIYPAIASNDDAPIILDTESGPSVLLLGSLSSPGRADATRWFLDAVWPLVRSRVRNAVVNVVGSGVPAWLERRAGKEGIVVHGYLPKLREILERTTVLAVPLRIGGGVRVKIIELMALGIPVVSTSLAAAGLKHTTQQLIPLADDASTFAEELARLLTEPAARSAASTRVYRHARAEYGIERARAALRQVIATAMSRDHARVSSG